MVFLYRFALKNYPLYNWIVIICFDLVKDKIKEFPSPLTDMEVHKCGLRLSGGSVYVLGYNDFDYIDVWVFERKWGEKNLGLNPSKLPKHQI